MSTTVFRRTNPHTQALDVEGVRFVIQQTADVADVMYQEPQHYRK